MFFDGWKKDDILHDSDLSRRLSEIQQNTFQELSFSSEDFTGQWFSIQKYQQDLGCTFENAQWVAELFDTENDNEIILAESQEILDRLIFLDKRIGTNSSTPEERKEFLSLLNDRKIAPTHTVLEQLGLGTPAARLAYPDSLDVYLLSAMIL